MDMYNFGALCIVHIFREDTFRFRCIIILKHERSQVGGLLIKCRNKVAYWTSCGIVQSCRTKTAWRRYDVASVRSYNDVTNQKIARIRHTDVFQNLRWNEVIFTYPTHVHYSFWEKHDFQVTCLIIYCHKNKNRFPSIEQHVRNTFPPSSSTSNFGIW